MNKTLKTLAISTISLFTLIGCDHSLTMSNTSHNNPTEFESDFKETSKKMLGEVLPFLPCAYYSYEFSKDDYGDPLCSLYFCYVNDDGEGENVADKAFNYYPYVCEENGYEVESSYYLAGDYYYDCYYADKVVSKNQGIEIIILRATQDGVPMVGAFAYTYVYEDPTVYPQIAVERLLGKKLASKVPVIAEEGMTYAFKFSYEETDQYRYDQLRIMVYGAMIEDEETYFNNCLQNGAILCDDLEDELIPLNEYPGWTGGAFDAYFFDDKGNLEFGIYFTYSMYYDAMLIDIWTMQYYE